MIKNFRELIWQKKKRLSTTTTTSQSHSNTIKIYKRCLKKADAAKPKNAKLNETMVTQVTTTEWAMSYDI